jgi:hypothetical protein
VCACVLGQLERMLRYSGRMDTTVLLEEPEAFDADKIQQDEVAAKQRPSGPGRGSRRSRTATTRQWSDQIRGHGRMGSTG